MITRLVLVDDHELFRDGLRIALSGVPEFDVVGQAGDARAGLELVRQHLPEVAIVDLSLPGASGITLAKDLLRCHPSCRVLMLTMHASDAFVRQAFAVGVCGYALKDQRGPEVIDAVRAVSRGDPYLAPRLPRSLLERPRSSPGDVIEPLHDLSAREREVFDLVAHGFTNESIGQALSISIKTVETHRARINRKLGVHSTGDLIRFAARHGLIRDGG